MAVCIFAPLVCFVVLDLAGGPLSRAPGRNVQLYTASTAAQVGTTALSIFFAALALVLVRPELRGTERAVSHVLRTPQSRFTLGTLGGGTLLGLAGVGAALEPDSTPAAWHLASVLNLVSLWGVASGLLGAGWWMLSSRSILAAEAILQSFVDAVPAEWVQEANQRAQAVWTAAFEEAKKPGHDLPVMPTDNRALGLPREDDVAVAIDALSGWVVASRGRPITGSLALLLERLYSKLLGANLFLAEQVLPTHLGQLLHSALETDDPRVVQTVVNWISELHVAWETAGLITTRSNHYSWLMPPLAEWVERRGLDFPAEQVVRAAFRTAAVRIGGQDAMMIALSHFVILFRYFVEQRNSWAAARLWTLLDSHLRAGKAPPHCLADILRVARRAGALDLPAFPHDAGEIELGGMCEWMALCLGHAVTAAMSRGDLAWARALAQGVRSLFPEGSPPRWNGTMQKQLDARFAHGDHSNRRIAITQFA